MAKMTNAQLTQEIHNLNNAIAGLVLSKVELEGSIMIQSAIISELLKGNRPTMLAITTIRAKCMTMIEQKYPFIKKHEEEGISESQLIAPGGR